MLPLRIESNLALEADTLVAKNAKSTTIEISIETYNRLHDIGEKLEKIAHKRHLGFDEILKVMLTVKPLDLTLQEIMQEDEIT